MKKYFANITTAQELKKAYKRLCLQLHPDKGGDPAEFKAMQAEYEEAAQRIARGEAAGNYQHNKKKDGTYKTAEEIYQEQQAFRVVIEKLITLEGLELEICGGWLWIGGNTAKQSKPPARNTPAVKKCGIGSPANGYGKAESITRWTKSATCTAAKSCSSAPPTN